MHRHPTRVPVWQAILQVVGVPYWPPPSSMQDCSQGPMFLCCMINLQCSFRHEDHHICLNQEFCLNLTWWRKLFHKWDGLSFFLMPEWVPIPGLKFLPTPQALWVMEPSSSTHGSGVRGQHHSNPCLLHMLWFKFTSGSNFF